MEVLRLDNDGVILREMKILTGNGGYTVTNSAPEAISAEIVEDPDVTGGYKLILGGKANVDQATVTVTDARNKSATLKVRVTNPIRPVLFDKEGTLEGNMCTRVRLNRFLSISLPVMAVIPLNL
ncbi:hypothetical protein SFC43_29485 [Bacteroides sp. CR5/BHMF/2]|nr:hypothetical protein [Bacteroides sp. CR5/BHMF/2]